MSDKKLHQNLVVFIAVNHDLPCQTTALTKPDSSVERLRTSVCPSYLNGEFSVAGLPSERCRFGPQLMPDAASPLSGQEERTYLAHMSHRLKI